MMNTRILAIATNHQRWNLQTEKFRVKQTIPETEWRDMNSGRKWQG